MFIPNPHSRLTGMALDGVTPKVDVLAFITGGYTINDQDLLIGPNVHTALIPEAATQPTIVPRSIIDHSNAGKTPSRWQSMWHWIQTPGVVGEQHLQVDMDGQIAQFMPFTVRADCNYKANRWQFGGEWYGALSHETADLGSATLQITPWSLPQFAALAAAHTAECVAYRIRCTQPATWQDSGIGHHNLFPEWSSYIGKTCPGAARIRQMDQLRSVVASNLAAYYHAVGGMCP
jgi:N-acetylmuramoyl-L-alanine amidase